MKIEATTTTDQCLHVCAFFVQFSTSFYLCMNVSFSKHKQCIILFKHCLHIAQVITMALNAWKKLRDNFISKTEKGIRQAINVMWTFYSSHLER